MKMMECWTCKHWHGEVCCNEVSTLYNEYTSDVEWCNEWESKQEDKHDES